MDSKNGQQADREGHVQVVCACTTQVGGGLLLQIVTLEWGSLGDCRAMLCRIAGSRRIAGPVTAAVPAC